MVRFKVRPRIDSSTTPCHTQLVALLACFATTGDIRATEQCAVSAKSLGECMASGAAGGRKGARGSFCYGDTEDDYRPEGTEGLTIISEAQQGEGFADIADQSLTWENKVGRPITTKGISTGLLSMHSAHLDPHPTVETRSSQCTNLLPKAPFSPRHVVALIAEKQIKETGVKGPSQKTAFRHFFERNSWTLPLALLTYLFGIKPSSGKHFSHFFFFSPGYQMNSTTKLFPPFDAIVMRSLLATRDQTQGLATNNQDGSSSTQTSLIEYPGGGYLKERQTQTDSRLLALPAEVLDDICARLPDSSLVAFARSSVQGYSAASKQYQARRSLVFDAADPKHDQTFLAPSEAWLSDLAIRNRHSSSARNDFDSKGLVRVLKYVCNVPEMGHGLDSDAEELWIARGYPTASSHLDKDHRLLTPGLEALHIVMTETDVAKEWSCLHACPPVGIVGRITDKTTLKTVTSKVSPGFCDSFWTVFQELKDKTKDGATRCSTLIVQDNDANTLKYRGLHDPYWLEMLAKERGTVGGTSHVVHTLHSADPESELFKPMLTNDSNDIEVRASLPITELASCVAYAWVKGSDYTIVGAERLDPRGLNLPAGTKQEEVAEIFEERILERVSWLTEDVDEDRIAGRRFSMMNLEDAPMAYSPEAWGRVEMQATAFPG